MTPIHDTNRIKDLMRGLNLRPRAKSHIDNVDRDALYFGITGFAIMLIIAYAIDLIESIWRYVHQVKP